VTRISVGLAAALPLLACPVCGARSVDAELWVVEPGTVGCAKNHRFDVARHGFLTLLGPRARTDTGDSVAMVAARAAFLDSGQYRPIANAILASAADGPVLDVGAGPAWYLAAALDGLDPSAVGVALDASRAAARRAAQRPRIAAVVGDAWSRLPVRDGVFGTVLSVFAPRNAAEIARVLRPGGVLVAVTPLPTHLDEIRGVVGLLAVDAGKPERLAAAFDGLLRVRRERPLRFAMSLDRESVAALVRMGPSAHHVADEHLSAAVGRLPPVLDVTADLTVSVLERS
jgi:23S rRNA (guanine745-N1)-methyltransferase